MKWWGTKLEGVEFGNAWALRSPETPHTNWIVGDHPGIPADSLRHFQHGDPPQGGMAQNLAVKWFEHSPDDPTSWGRCKSLSRGCTLSLLVGTGCFELFFRHGDAELTVVLESPGDFVVWGPGVHHGWRVLKHSTVMTLRWEMSRF